MARATDTPSLRLARFMATRLCHDIASPIGTFMGALDLAAEDAAMAAEAISLANQAAQEMAQRLALIRAAWGMDPEPVDLAGLQRLAAGLHGTRHRLMLDPSLPGRFSQAETQLVLNVLLLAAEALPMGGRIVVSGDVAGDVTLQLDGPRASWPAGFAALLAQPELAWDALESPRSVQGPLTVLCAYTAGLSLSLRQAAEGACATLVLGLRHEP